MKKHQFLTQFIANLFAGCIVAFIGVLGSLLVFGLSTPDYISIVLIGITTVGIFLFQILYAFIKRKWYVINGVIFFTLALLLLLIMDLNDWEFVAIVTALSLGFALLPALITTIVRNIMDNKIL